MKQIELNQITQKSPDNILEDNKIKLDHLQSEVEIPDYLDNADKRITFKSASTTQLLEHQYFLHDSKADQQLSQNITPEQYFKLQRFCINWNWPIFFEYFFYHFIFYFILGPLTYFLLFKFTGKILLKNLFFFHLPIHFFYFTMIYALQMFFTVIYFVFPEQNTQFIEILVMWLLNFFRCIANSSKFGTFPKEKIILYKTHIIPETMQYADSFLYGYTLQTSKVIYEESWSSFKLNEFEPSMFFINFFLPASKKLDEELNNLTNELQVHHFLPEVYQPEPLCYEIKYDKFYYGFAIIAKFIKEFEANYQIKNLNYLGIILGFSISFFPLFYSLGSGEFIFYSVQEVVRIICLNCFITYLSFQSLMFLLIGIRDLQRKMFLFIQCAHIISPKKKDHYLEKKVLPTINIIRPANLKVKLTIIKHIFIQSWTILRQVCFSYGRSFYLRTKVFFSFLIIEKIVSIIFLLLFLFNFIQVKNVVVIYIFLWTLMFLLLMIFMLLLSAEINSNYDEFKNLIEDLNNIFTDMVRMKKYYFEYKLIPKNFLHQKFLEQLKQVTNNDISNLDPYICRVNTAIFDAKRNLEVDSRNNCLEFFQIPITYKLLGQLSVALGTLFGFAIQQWIQTNKK